MDIKISLGNKGQLQAGMSAAYVFIFAGICLFSIAIVLMVVSDNIIAIHLYSYAVQFGCNPTVLGVFEALRTVLPFMALLSMGLGILVVGISLQGMW